jgi:hypothetical protein
VHIAHPSWWLALALTAALLLPFLSSQRSRRATRFHFIFLLVACAALGLFYLNEMRQNTRVLRDWDYKAFWLYGRVAADGKDFYVPQNYLRAAEGLGISENFRVEVLEVGMRYPPPTIFLFLPLGWMSPSVGLAFWYVLQSAALLGSVWLLWKRYLVDLGYPGLAAVSALAMLLHPVGWTFHVAQTNALLLLFTLLYMKDRDRWPGGCWIAAGLLVKPILGILLLIPIRRRQWNTLLAAGITLAGMAILTLLAFGLRPFTSYLSQGPLTRFGLDLYVVPMNQSLFSWVLRLTHADLAAPVSFFHPVFVALAAMVMGVTAWAILRRPLPDGDWESALLLALALVIYPNTLLHYGALLLIPFLLIWHRRGTLPGGGLATVALLAAAYALLAAFPAHSFFVFAGTWIGLVRLGFRGAGRELAPASAGSGAL